MFAVFVSVTAAIDLYAFDNYPVLSTVIYMLCSSEEGQHEEKMKSKISHDRVHIYRMDKENVWRELMFDLLNESQFCSRATSKVWKYCTPMAVAAVVVVAVWSTFQKRQGAPAHTPRQHPSPSLPQGCRNYHNSTTTMTKGNNLISMYAKRETDAGTVFPKTSTSFHTPAHICFSTMIKPTKTRPLDHPLLAQVMSSTSFTRRLPSSTPPPPPCLFHMLTFSLGDKPAVFIWRSSVSDMLISPNMWHNRQTNQLICESCSSRGRRMNNVIFSFRMSNASVNHWWGRVAGELISAPQSAAERASY